MNDKSVLISIQPQWCKLIADGKKTMEVRKTKPNLDTPFKVYIYCTNKEVLAQSSMEGWYFTASRNSEKELALCGSKILNGKVIGEFVCDKIECVGIPYPAYSGELDRRYIEKSCVDYDALHRYCGHGNLYFWHISNLQIYDNPIPLADFKGGIKRPPQSWCYINEEE